MFILPLIFKCLLISFENMFSFYNVHFFIIIYRVPHNTHTCINAHMCVTYFPLCIYTCVNMYLCVCVYLYFPVCIYTCINMHQCMCFCVIFFVEFGWFALIFIYYHTCIHNLMQWQLTSTKFVLPLFHPDVFFLPHILQMIHLNMLVPYLWTSQRKTQEGKCCWILSEGC